MSLVTPFVERLRQFTAALQRSFRISENTFLIILAVIIGVLGGLGNYAFRKTIELIHWGVFTKGEQFFGFSLHEWSPERLVDRAKPRAHAGAGRQRQRTRAQGTGPGGSGRRGSGARRRRWGPRGGGVIARPRLPPRRRPR